MATIRDPKTFNLYVVFNEAGRPIAISNIDTGAPVDDLHVFADDAVVWVGPENFAIAFDDESPLEGTAFSRGVRSTRSKKVKGKVKTGLPRGRRYKYSVEAAGGMLDPQIIIDN